jgi:hypothetical protein
LTNLLVSAGGGEPQSDTATPLSMPADSKIERLAVHVGQQ